MAEIMTVDFCVGRFPSPTMAQKKAQESVSVTILRSEASRIALSMLDGNARSPRLYMQQLPPAVPFTRHHAGSRVLHIHGHLPLLNP